MACQRARLWRICAVCLSVISFALFAAGAASLLQGRYAESPLKPVALDYHFPPRITFEGFEVSHTFEVRNPADRRVRILSVERSCGCSEARLDADTLAPRDRTRLHLSSKVGVGEAHQAFYAILHTDLAEAPRWTCRYSVATYPPIEASPQAINVGPVAPASVSEQDVSVHVYEDSSPGSAPPVLDTSIG